MFEHFVSFNVHIQTGSEVKFQDFTGCGQVVGGVTPFWNCLTKCSLNLMKKKTMSSSKIVVGQ